MQASGWFITALQWRPIRQFTKRKIENGRGDADEILLTLVMADYDAFEARLWMVARLAGCLTLLLRDSGETRRYIRMIN